MQQVAQQSAHLFACEVFSNFEPCIGITFVLTKASARLANHINYFGYDGRFGWHGDSPRISLHKLASESTEALVSDMIETVLAPTTNYRVVAWLKSHPKLCVFGSRGSRRLGAISSLVFDSLRREGNGVGFKDVTCHCEVQYVKTLGEEVETGSRETFMV
jgi:hypothetical protein